MYNKILLALALDLEGVNNVAASLIQGFYEEAKNGRRHVIRQSLK